MGKYPCEKLKPFTRHRMNYKSMKKLEKLSKVYDIAGSEFIYLYEYKFISCIK